MVAPGEEHGVGDLQAVERVQPERREDGLDEAHPGDHPGGQALLGGAREDLDHRRLADQRVAGDGVHHPRGAAREAQHAVGDLVVHAGELRVALVDGVERLVVRPGGEIGDGRVMGGAQVDLVGASRAAQARVICAGLPGPAPRRHALRHSQPSPSGIRYQPTYRPAPPAVDKRGPPLPGRRRPPNPRGSGSSPSRRCSGGFGRRGDA